MVATSGESVYRDYGVTRDGPPSDATDDVVVRWPDFGLFRPTCDAYMYVRSADRAVLVCQGLCTRRERHSYHCQQH